MPVRRESAIPLDMYLNPQSSTNLSGRGDSLSLGDDSQHSSASESTLSEIGGRQSDLSSIGNNSDMLALDTRSLDCDVILEEEDEDLIDDPSAAQPQRGLLKPNNSSQALPKKPVRRVSEFPESLGNPLEGANSPSPEIAAQPGEDSGASFANEAQPMQSAMSNSSDHSGAGRAPAMATSLPPKVSSPKKPIRRRSSVPEDLVPEKAKNTDTVRTTHETQYSPGTDSTVSETTQDTMEDHLSENCSTIAEEGSDGSLNAETGEELPPLQDHSGTEAFSDSVFSGSFSSTRKRGSDCSLNEEAGQVLPPLKEAEE